jgi:SRSO17 transposase
MHQSLHHLVADAPWNDEQMLAEVRRHVLPTMSVAAKKWTILADRKRRWSGYDLATAGGGAGP